MNDARSHRVREIEGDAPAQNLCIGRMYAASPSLSLLEHPAYELAVIRCAT